MKKLFGVALIGASSLALASCGKESTKIDVGVILPNGTEERWKNQDGAWLSEELEEAGLSYEILYSESDVSKEKSNTESLIARGAKVIIITSHEGGAGALKAAKDAGVKVIAHDRMTKSDSQTADYYTTFNSWDVGKAMGQHLVTQATNDGCTVEEKCDLAVFSGAKTDWPNATYFFGGALEVLHPELNRFNIVNVSDDLKSELATYSGSSAITEATMNDANKNTLQSMMGYVDTKWGSDDAGKALGTALATSLNEFDKSNETLYMLAPNDNENQAIRVELAKMTNPYGTLYSTGQDASNVAIASLMGDYTAGKGKQSMTVFKDTSKLVENSVKIAQNIVNDKDALNGLSKGQPIDGVDTVYSPVDTLLASDKQNIYNLIFKSGYKDKNNSAFSGIDFSGLS